MKCVNVNGENLCLPKEPDINCNSNNGGRYIWTGYGFTQSKDWQCLCTKPEIYNGPDCSIKNPSYCSNGTLADDLNTPLRNICKCDKGTELLFRYNNTPMCVSNDPSFGGGSDGLYGNYHKKPDWRNVYYMTNDADQWSKDIVSQFDYFDFKKVLDVLNNDKNIGKLKLDQQIVNDLSQLDVVFTSSTFDPNYTIKVPYRYFTQTYMP
jgi:hypothetical protein